MRIVPAAFAPRVIEAVRPPSVCASGACTVSVARPVSRTPPSSSSAYSPRSIVSGTTDTGMTATPVTVSAAAVNGSSSIDVTRPLMPSASCRARIEAASFLRGQRTRKRIWPLITGAHVILFTPEAEELRAVFRDALGWKHVDAGDGWLIFALPPAEIAAHPSEAGDTHHALYFTCDDIAATIDELQAKGLEIRGEPEDRGWGIAATLVLPGGVEVTLYEPRHPLAVS